MERLKICMLLFPHLTLQDFVGPYDVFSRVPDYFDVMIVSEETSIIAAEGGLQIKPALTLEQCPHADILFVPGGRGINALLTNPAYITFLQARAKQARYITSVCTGSLVLAAAGLLNGYKATTHWRSLELLRMFNVEVLKERVVIDRNRITGGGVTAGLDFALSLIALICGDERAKMVQLALEYDPNPPFHSGSPATAEQSVLEKVYAATQKSFDERRAIIDTLPK